MSYTPIDILDYVMDHNMEASFLKALSMCKENFTIGELAVKEFKEEEGGVRFISPDYKINVPLTDDDVITAYKNGLYVSAFISRHKEAYRVHFLCHPYPVNMKPQFEDEITKEVIKYMILQTIITLKLDNKEKIRKYCV